MLQRKSVLMIIVLVPVILLSVAIAPTKANTGNPSTPEVIISFQEAGSVADDEAASLSMAEEPESPVVVDGGGDADQYPPMPLPQWSPPRDENFAGNGMVMYDVAAGRELNLGQQDSMGLPGLPADAVDGSPSPGDAEPEGPEPREFSSLTRVAAPASHPWSVNVRMLVDWPNGGRSGCSGTLVDPRWVVTAGHCIFSDSDGGWATGVRVVPAYSNGNEPFGAALAVHLFSWSGWTDNGDWEWDIAHIRLNQPIGALTGWHGYGYNSSDSFFEDNTFHNPGYPGEGPYNFEHMYYWYGDYDDTDSHIVRHNDLSYGGQSGSGAYHLSGSNRYIYGVLSHGTSTWTGHTRITDDKFDYIRDTVVSGTPATADMIPLAVRTTPSSLTAGDRPSSLTFLIHNYASVSFNGSFAVRLYLSSNNDISTSDRLLGTAQYSGQLGAKQTARITTSTLPVIPLDEEGNQWLGVIVLVADHDTSNNDTDGWDASQITIRPYLPDTPINVRASNATSPYKVTINWSAAARATSYEVHRATSTTGAKTRIGTTSQLQLEDRSGDPGTPYYYFVRAVAVNGRVSGYSQPAVGRRPFFYTMPVILE